MVKVLSSKRKTKTRVIQPPRSRRESIPRRLPPRLPKLTRSRAAPSRERPAEPQVALQWEPSQETRGPVPQLEQLRGPSAAGGNRRKPTKKPNNKANKRARAKN